MKASFLVAALLAVSGMEAGAQPLGQNFSFGAPPDVLGNEHYGALPRRSGEVAPAVERGRVSRARRRSAMAGNSRRHRR